MSIICILENVEMKYVINGKFLTQKKTGVQRFCQEIVLAIDKGKKEDIVIELLIPEKTILSPEIKDLKRIQVKKYGKLRGIAWEQICLPYYIIKKKAIGIHLGNVAPLVRPDIVCIHDMNAIANPQWYRMLYVLWCKIIYFNIKIRGKKIITVSDFSKKEIMKYLCIKKEKIIVTVEGWSQIEKAKADYTVIDELGLNSKGYFLSIYQMMPNKNFKWIIEVAKRNPNELFIVTGWANKKVIKNERGMSIPTNIKLIGYVSDNKLKSLIEECKAFLFPSIYEGFGLPPLEALAINGNVVVSNIEVMQEIFGDAINYVEPSKYDVDLSGLTEISHVEKKRILEHYTWENAAEIILKELYKDKKDVKNKKKTNK